MLVQSFGMLKKICNISSPSWESCMAFESVKTVADTSEEAILLASIQSASRKGRSLEKIRFVKPKKWLSVQKNGNLCHREQKIKKKSLWNKALKHLLNSNL